MDSISMEDKSGAETTSVPRGSTSTVKPTHHHHSFSAGGWDRSSKRYGNKDRKIGHRRVDEAGQVTYKKIETSQICGSIQLGIQTAISSLASQPDRDLLMLDFTMIETTNFVHDGTNCTPAHHYSDFKFKNYAPIAFRYFRDLFGIAPEDFLQSFGTEPLRELTNPGASGSVFYLTYDDEFIIKTVQHKEAEFLQKLLPGYYMVRLAYIASLIFSLLFLLNFFSFQPLKLMFHPLSLTPDDYYRISIKILGLFFPSSLAFTVIFVEERMFGQ
jgi:hypothetical protein